MAEQEKFGVSNITMQSSSRQSTFDFANVEDFQDVDKDTKQHTIPFNQSYIAHAPGRNLFTLNSRYTYFGGYGTSKDISGSAEDLTGHRNERRHNYGISKFSKSSPDLRHVSYQATDDDDVTEEEIHEYLVRELDIEAELENYSENNEMRVCGENNENYSKRSIEVKTEILNRKSLTFGANKPTVNISEKCNETETTHAPESCADVSRRYADGEETKSDILEKGWKTILHSGKADLRKSLESLNSFKQDANSRKIQNVDTFGNKNFGNSGSSPLQHGLRIDEKDRETGIKRSDEMAGITTDTTCKKRQEISQEHIDEIGSELTESTSSICESSSTVIKDCYSEVTDIDNSEWKTLFAEKTSNTDNGNVNYDIITLPQGKITNDNKEKQTKSRIVNFQTDKTDVGTCTLKENTAVSKSLPQFDLSKTNYSNLLPQTPTTEGTSENRIESTSDSSIVRMDKMTGLSQEISDNCDISADKTSDSEALTIVQQTCSISPISLRVLNSNDDFIYNEVFYESNSREESTVWKSMEENRERSINSAVEVSAIRQSSICVRENEKITNDCNTFLPHSVVKTHEPRNRWPTDNTGAATNVESSQEKTDNSLIKNMMGMFCLLGLKDSPQGGFYNNGISNNERKAGSHISYPNQSQELSVDQRISTTLNTTYHQPAQKILPKLDEEDQETNIRISDETGNLPQDIKTTLFSSNENREIEIDSFYDREQNELFDDVDRNSDNFTSNIREQKIQQITLYENPQKPATVEDYIGDILTGNNTETKDETCRDKDFLLNLEADEILCLSDSEQEKQEQTVRLQDIQGNNDERILRKTMTQELLLQTPDTSDENLKNQNELHVFETTKERLEVNMRENPAIDYDTDNEDLLMTCNEEGLSSSQEKTKEERLGNMITTTHLEINRNKWSNSYIMPLRVTNDFEFKTGNFNVLVLDSKLTPTSPDVKPTVVTLNLFAYDTEGKYFPKQNVEVSEVIIPMNWEQNLKGENLNIPDLTNSMNGECIDSFDVEEQTIQSNPNNLDQHLAELPIITDKQDFKNHLDQEDYANETHDEMFTTKETKEDYLIPETVHKVDVKVTNDFVDRLLSFEMEEVKEKIPKDEQEKDENLFSEFDGIFLPQNEIHETVTKEKKNGDLFGSEFDEFFISEEELEDNEGTVDYHEGNNVILSEANEDTLSGVTKPEVMKHFFQLNKKVSEGVTRTVHDKNSQYLTQLDDVLQPQYVQEIVQTKVKIQHDKKDCFLETDKYFDSMTQVGESKKENRCDKQIEGSSELSEQRENEEPETNNGDKSIIPNTDLITFQSQIIEILPSQKNRHDDDLNIKGQKQKENEGETTIEQMMFHTEKDFSTVTSYNVSKNQYHDELILIISNKNYPIDSGYLNDVGDGVDHNDDDSVYSDEKLENNDDNNNDSVDSVHSGDELDAINDNNNNGSVYGGDNNENGSDWENIDDYNECDNDIRRYTSPITDDLSFITSNYEASVESSCESTPNQKNVPWDVTVSYSNLDQTSSQHKVLRASYTIIQPEVYYVKNETPDIRVSINGKDIDDENSSGKNNLQSKTSLVKTISYQQKDQTTEDKKVSPCRGTSLDKDDQYRTTMDIQQTRKQASVSYTLFQKLDQQEFQKTYFELNYDMAEDEGGKRLSSHSDVKEKPFVISYANIEDIKQPEMTASINLPSIEETYEDDDFDFSDTQVSSENERMEILQSFQSLPPLRPSTPLPPVSSSPSLSQSPVSPSMVTTEEETQLYTVHFTTLENQTQENIPQQLELTYNLPEPSVKANEKYPGNISHSPSPSPEKTSEDQGMNTFHEVPSNNQMLPTICNKHEEIIHHSFQAPLEISPKDLSQQSSIITHTEVPQSTKVTRPPVWSFAQSVFHTDGESKTFFKIIDNRKKCFQSSTFVYRGERVKVCKKVSVFKNSKQDIDDELSLDTKENEDYRGYSEIWDDGNLIPDNNIVEETDGSVTRSAVGYEMATAQGLFPLEESRNCSWYLNISGSRGMCQICSNNLDAIAVEDDNTLLGSEKFINGQHRWIIQGLGIFCAVGVCYPGEETGSWFKGGKWVWTTDGLKYSETEGIQRSEFGQWRNEDLLEVILDCEKQKLKIVNLRTNIEASLYGFKQEIYPYFNIYKGSCIRLLETS